MLYNEVTCKYVALVGCSECKLHQLKLLEIDTFDAPMTQNGQIFVTPLFLYRYSIPTVLGNSRHTGFLTSNSARAEMYGVERETLLSGWRGADNVDYTIVAAAPIRSDVLILEVQYSFKMPNYIKNVLRQPVRTPNYDS